MDETPLSIIIPAYNEADRLGGTLERIMAWLRQRQRDHTELLVVDDGSSDATIALAEEVLASWPQARVLSNGSNRGKGYTVRHGVLAARGQMILFSDADLSTPIEELLKLEASLGHAEIAIGSRATAGAEILKHQPAYRELLGRAFNLAVQAMALGGISDSQCGFKLFRRGAARAVFSRSVIDGFAFDVEVLFVARRLGFRVAEVPVVWINDEASRVSPLRDGMIMLADVAKIRSLHRELG